nr:O-acetyltransferase OatA [Streptococcus thermophilus]
MGLLYNFGITNTSKLPELEGLRAVAALGIVATHVSFQTGLGSRLLERFDYFVAVFFALSAFLLARGPRRPGYYRRRFARIAPGYLACVCIVMAALPSLTALSPVQAVAQVFMLQIYVPDGLVPGLTQLWSLCIEVAFYLVLPLYLVLGLRARGIALLAAVVFGLGWPWLAALVDAPVNLQIWPPSYAPWFAVGLLCAEFERLSAVPLLSKARPFRWVFPALALVVAWASGQIGPPGLQHPTPAEFNARVILGTVFAALFVVPFALAPVTGSGRHAKVPFLASPVMSALGKWSYGIFLWHVAVLEIAFPVLGVDPFSGSGVDFGLVLVFTVAVSVAVAYISFELVEAPAMHLILGRSPTDAGQAATGGRSLPAPLAGKAGDGNATRNGDQY